MLTDYIKALVYSYRDFRRDNLRCASTEMLDRRAAETIESIYFLFHKKYRRNHKPHRQFRRHPERQNIAPKQEANGLLNDAGKQRTGGLVGR